MLRVQNEQYIFHLADLEKKLLAVILGFYPVIPAAHYTLSKSPNAADKAHQKLLDEAMAEHRNENKKLAQEFLADDKRFHEVEGGVEMTLSAGDIEWLLQVLNDVYVGNWILLGSPDKSPSEIEAHELNEGQIGAMEIAQFFQEVLLHSIRKP